MLAAPLHAAVDRQVACQIAARLVETGRNSLARLTVEVRPGRIALRGQVQTFYEKQLAIQTCLMVAGGEWLIDAAEVAVRTPPAP
jgi:osmotically-inducible protein OsmY